MDKKQYLTKAFVRQKKQEKFCYKEQNPNVRGISENESSYVLCLNLTSPKNICQQTKKNKVKLL